MLHTLSTTVLLLIPLLIVAQPFTQARNLQQQNTDAHSLLSTTWSPSTYPNPTRDIDKCNRRGVKSWVCDPDGVISYTTANVIESLVQDISTGTSPYALAPCGALGKQGYQVAVALMRKINVASTVTPADAARTFAKSLHDAWGVGFSECNNGVLLLLAVDDRQVYISTGQGAQRAMPDDQAAVIIHRMKPSLRAGDYDIAVERAVREMGLALAGATFEEPHDWVGTVFGVGVVVIILWAFVGGVRQHFIKRQQQRRATTLLERLRQEQQEATTHHRFPTTSCPICFDQLSSDALTSGGVNGGGGDAHGAHTHHHNEDHGNNDDDDDVLTNDDDVLTERNPLLQHQHPPAGTQGGPVLSGLRKRPLALPCGHVFCEPCIDQWLTSHTTCPICRADLGTDPPPDNNTPPPPPRTTDPPTQPPPQSRPRPTWWRYRGHWPPRARCWNEAAYLSEFDFRLRRLHMLYPDVVTDMVVADLLAQARRGQVVDWQGVVARDMADRAERARLEHRGRSGTSMSFGGGRSGGGGGAGGSW